MRGAAGCGHIDGTLVVVATIKLPFPTADEDSLLVLGFVIGLFPRVAWQVVQAAIKKFTGAFVVPSLRTALPLSDLDGLTVWHETRLDEEDIENIPNMATADFGGTDAEHKAPPNRIIDWVDQAILCTQLGLEGDGASGSEELVRRWRNLTIDSAPGTGMVYR